MIFIGIGANLPSVAHGAPLAGCRATIAILNARKVPVIRRSRWYASRPVPPSDQPPYINGVLEVETELAPEALLQVLLDVECGFGRSRGERNAARTLDLDLLAYHAVLMQGGQGPELPHPRMHERAFVLRPLADLAPWWRHPRLGFSTLEMLAAVPRDQVVEAIEDEVDGNCRMRDDERRVFRRLP